VATSDSEWITGNSETGGPSAVGSEWPTTRPAEESHSSFPVLRCTN